jgi:hypothetical protein
VPRICPPFGHWTVGAGGGGSRRHVVGDWSCQIRLQSPGCRDGLSQSYNALEPAVSLCNTCVVPVDDYVGGGYEDDNDDVDARSLAPVERPLARGR